MRIPLRCCVLLVGFLLAGSASGWACIWDSETVFSEKAEPWEMERLIGTDYRQEIDVERYKEKLAALMAKSNPKDSDWLNEVAGTYLRLGKARMAVNLLAPVEKRFPNNYGLNANLGTAYHMLGRYKDAERHIARDLELEPQGHFGLEKYHLALLQYHLRDVDWKRTHVYVDEFSLPLYLSAGPVFGRGRKITGIKNVDPAFLGTNAPPYRAKWDLAQDPKLTEGLLYMARLNPKDPAVYEMLGVLCWKNRDGNLTSACFAKAISLGSPKSATLRVKIDSRLGSKAEVRP